MTRAMFITVLHRHAGEPEVQSDESFVDVEPDEWYTDAVAWAKQNGITAGMDETHFAPHENITREQMAVMLYRYEKHRKFTQTFPHSATPIQSARSR